MCIISCGVAPLSSWMLLTLAAPALPSHTGKLCWRHISIKKTAGAYIQLQLWWSEVAPCPWQQPSGRRTYRLPLIPGGVGSIFILLFGQKIHVFLKLQPAVYTHLLCTAKLNLTLWWWDPSTSHNLYPAYDQLSKVEKNPATCWEPMLLPLRRFR